MCKSDFNLESDLHSHEKYPLREPVGTWSNFHLVNEHTLIVTSLDRLSLYTLRKLDGSPQRQASYLLPKMPNFISSPFYVIYATPPFHNIATRPDLIPARIPSLQSQIMVLEILPTAWPVILVIDMAIFLQQAMFPETLDEIPWSKWGPQHTCCFPHHPSHRISVFGNRMAYSLPQDHVPEPGERLKGFTNRDDYFYVHIWDFNKRIIARAENSHNCSPLNGLVCKPGQLAQSCFTEDVVSEHPYIATVCRTPFSTHFFHKLFLEQERFILTRVSALDYEFYAAMV